MLLYFSGHGILDEAHGSTSPRRTRSVKRPRSTAVSADFVNELMRRMPLASPGADARLLQQRRLRARDSRRAAASAPGERFEGRGRVVITATDALQYAFEGGRVEGEAASSVFTSVLVDGLRSGRRGSERDGSVTLDELYDYVYGRVLDASPRQRPHKWAFGVEGQIVVARDGPGGNPVGRAARAAHGREHRESAGFDAAAARLVSPSGRVGRGRSARSRRDRARPRARAQRRSNDPPRTSPPAATPRSPSSTRGRKVGSTTSAPSSSASPPDVRSRRCRSSPSRPFPRPPTSATARPATSTARSPIRD